MKKLLCILLCVLLLCGCALVADVTTLSGDDLVVALAFPAEDFAQMSTEEKTAYTGACLELEIMNGGLCQFFANNPDCAAYVPTALENLGATEQLDLYTHFIAANGIDPLDVRFQTEDMEAFSALYDLYPWDDFDNAYLEMKPMPDLLEAYVQAHADAFE